MFNPPNIKIYYFEYTLNQLLEWYSRKSGQSDTNDISILKALKLLFFVSAVNANPESEETLLDNVFNEFVAMPFGHVESTVYNKIRESKGRLEYFNIDTHTTTRISPFDSNKGNLHIKAEIQRSIKLLSEKNPELILYSAFDLVEVSHLWYSWQVNYKKAKSQDLGSYKISQMDIKLESKIYHL